MKKTRNHPDELIIGLVSISDRASSGVYEDQGVPALRDWFSQAVASPWQMETRLIPDERARIEQTIIELVDHVGCDLVLTTGVPGLLGAMSHPKQRWPSPPVRCLALASKCGKSA